MLSPFRLWSVYRVTFMRAYTQPVEIFGNVSTPFGTLAIRWHPLKIFYRDRPKETPPSGGGEVKRKKGSQI